jgi:hypothetical protein
LTEARSNALAQGKLILLMAGRPSCSVCAYMKQSICESAEVRPLIDEVFVPWFANMDFSPDYLPYGADLGAFSLPMTCVVDPHTTNAWLLRVTGPYTAETYAGYLRQGAQRAPPWPSNLAPGQVIRDSQFQVRGSLWSSLGTAVVYQRVRPLAIPGGSFQPATASPDWSVSLAGVITSGVSNQFVFEAYAIYGGTASATNQLQFTYLPTPPASDPIISGIRMAGGVVHLSLTNLQAGFTHWLLRSSDPAQTNGWATVTSVVSLVDWAEVTDPVSPDWERAFYRLYRAP